MKRKILLSLVIIGQLFIFGCINPNEVQLSPRYQHLLEMSATNVEGMLKDCQAGNQESCEKGLKKASELLNHIVDASYGRAD